MKKTGALCLLNSNAIFLQTTKSRNLSLFSLNVLIIVLMDVVTYWFDLWLKFNRSFSFRDFVEKGAVGAIAPMVSKYSDKDKMLPQV